MISSNFSRQLKASWGCSEGTDWRGVLWNARLAGREALYFTAVIFTAHRLGRAVARRDGAQVERQPAAATLIMRRGAVVAQVLRFDADGSALAMQEDAESPRTLILIYDWPSFSIEPFGLESSQADIGPSTQVYTYIYIYRIGLSPQSHSDNLQGETEPCAARAWANAASSSSTRSPCVRCDDRHSTTSSGSTPILYIYMYTYVRIYMLYIQIYIL